MDDAAAHANTARLNAVRMEVFAVAADAFRQLAGTGKNSDLMCDSARSVVGAIVARYGSDNPANDMALRRAVKKLRTTMAYGADAQSTNIRVDLYLKTLTEAAQRLEPHAPLATIQCGGEAGMQVAALRRDGAPLLTRRQRDAMLQFLLPSSIAGEDFGNLPILKQVLQRALDMAAASHDDLKAVQGETPEALHHKRMALLHARYPSESEDDKFGAIAIFRLEQATENLLHAVVKRDASEHHDHAKDISRHQYKHAERAMAAVLQEMGDWDDALSRQRIGQFCDRVRVHEQNNVGYDPASITR